MRRATLIVNPAAGRAGLLAAQMPEVRRLLSEEGYAVEVVGTSAAVGSGEELARAAATTSALVLACGGDGTVHAVVQGLAHTGVALGVLPLGTANALARNLELPMEPVAALKCLLGYRARVVPLGEVVTATERQYFVVMAGCGPDGALVHRLAQPESAGMKARLGRSAYYAYAGRLFFGRRWPVFEVEWRVAGSEVWERSAAVAMMVSRVPDLGGLFSGLTPGAGLGDEALHVKVLRAPGQVSLPAWMVASRLRVKNPWVMTVDAAEVRCTGLGVGTVRGQADAEPVGLLPLALRVVKGALTLLMPG